MSGKRVELTDEALENVNGGFLAWNKNPDAKKNIGI